MFYSHLTECRNLSWCKHGVGEQFACAGEVGTSTWYTVQTSYDLECCICAEPVVPVDNFESSLDGTNAVFKKSAASNNAVVEEEAHNSTV